MRKLGWFTRMAKAASRFTGRPLCFALAAGVVLVWAITGPLFYFLIRQMARIQMPERT